MGRAIEIVLVSAVVGCTIVPNPAYEPGDAESSTSGGSPSGSVSGGPSTSGSIDDDTSTSGQELVTSSDDVSSTSIRNAWNKSAHASFLAQLANRL